MIKRTYFANCCVYSPEMNLRATVTFSFSCISFFAQTAQTLTAYAKANSGLSSYYQTEQIHVVQLSRIT